MSLMVARVKRMRERLENMGERPVGDRHVPERRGLLPLLPSEPDVPSSPSRRMLTWLARPLRVELLPLRVDRDPRPKLDALPNLRASRVRCAAGMMLWARSQQCSAVLLSKRPQLLAAGAHRWALSMDPRT
jgi:hypothetical protein